jgi:hypothetical protein
VIDGIDYGPAIAAVHDLAAWAFGLAVRDVADWPEGQRRVRTARRFVLAHLRGKRPRGLPMEDVLFTAGLLARIFEADLRLPLTDMLAIFDRLGFPTEDVPLRPRAPSATSWTHDPSIKPRPAAQPAPSDACNACGQHDPRFRRAA